MKPPDQSEAATFRLIIVRRNGSEILFSSRESGWTLPRAQAFPRQRIAWQLREELKEQLGLPTYCLFLRSFTAPNGPRENYAVLESIKQNDGPPKGTCWVPRMTSECQFDRALGDKEAIEEFLRELDSYVSEPKTGPFGRPGWLRELFEWSQEQLSPLGLRVNENFQQFNASPTFSLIRLETNGPAAWFKATGKPNAHELSDNDVPCTPLSRIPAFNSWSPSVVEFVARGGTFKHNAGPNLRALHLGEGGERLCGTSNRLNRKKVRAPGCSVQRPKTPEAHRSDSTFSGAHDRIHGRAGKAVPGSSRAPGT